MSICSKTDKGCSVGRLHTHFVPIERLMSIMYDIAPFVFRGMLSLRTIRTLY